MTGAMKTGIFFHEIFKRNLPVIGDKYQNFSQILNQFEGNGNIVFYTLRPVSEELLLQVHAKEMLEGVKNYSGYEAALYAADGCVQALERMWTGEIDNAMLYYGSCHHASRNSAWGGCSISGCGVAIANLRQKFGRRRFAVLDTDSHHGDGAREIFMGDRDILHVCFCDYDSIEDGGTKIDIATGWHESDEEYLRKVEENFIPRVSEFKPDMIIHHLGHDTAQGDYGDRGLSKDFFVKLARLLKGCADEFCQGRYLAMTGGGARQDIAEYIYPRTIRVLVGEEPTAEGSA